MLEGALLAPCLEMERVVGVTRFELDLRRKRPFDNLSSVSLGQEAKRHLAS